MTQTAEVSADWLATLPANLQRHMKDYERLADLALHNGQPYHSVRIPDTDFIEAGAHTGRLLGWAISATTQKGWEYENTTSLGDGHMWLLFKNPYIFS